jgi:hypothetical protein
MSTSMSESQQFLFEDSSSPDDSDIDKLILDDDVEQAMVIVIDVRMPFGYPRISIPGLAHYEGGPA